jgi:hypothetical protein
MRPKTWLMIGISIVIAAALVFLTWHYYVEPSTETHGTGGNGAIFGNLTSITEIINPGGTTDYILTLEQVVPYNVGNTFRINSTISGAKYLYLAEIGDTIIIETSYLDNSRIVRVMIDKGGV